MPDIFDQISTKKDIFDQISPTKTPVLGDLQPRTPQAGTDFVETSPSPARIQGGEIATTQGTAIPDETQFQELAKQVGFKGREIVGRVKTAEPKQFKGFRSEMGDALARGLVNTTAGGLDALERAAQSSAFDPGMFSNAAEILREIGKDADIQAAVLPKNAGKLKKAGAFVANAVGETLPFMAASVGSTMLTGTPLAAFTTSFTVEGENARQEALAAGASEEEADNEAFIVGTINGALESLQVDEVLRFSGVGKASKEAFIKAVKDRSMKKLAKAGGKLTLAAARTSVTEGLQEALQETTSLLVPGLSGRELPSPEEAFKRIGQAAVGGAVVGPLLGGVSSAAGFGTDTEQPQPETTPDGIPLIGSIQPGDAAEVGADIITEPTVGEEVVETPFEREQDGKLDEERDIQSRTRPGQVQSQQGQRPAEAEDALEVQRQEEVTPSVQAEGVASATPDAAAINAQRRASRLEAVKRQAEQRKTSRDAAVEREAVKIANANKRPVFIQEGRILSREPGGDFETVQPESVEAKQEVSDTQKPAESDVSPIKAIEQKAESKGIKLDVFEDKKRNQINVSKIIVPENERGKGVGVDILGEIIDEADKNGQTITVTPSTDFGGTSVKRLKDFYKRLGFVENKGKNKDFTISDTMFREPAAAKVKKTVTKAPKKQVKPTPAVKKARKTVAKTDPTAFVSAKVSSEDVIGAVLAKKKPKSRKFKGPQPTSQAKAKKLRDFQADKKVKQRGLSTSIKQVAVEKGMADFFEDVDIPEFNVLDLKKQAARATKLMKADPARARRIAMGQEAAPANINPEALLVAVAKQAELEGDGDTLRDLSLLSTLTTDATTMGQRIRTLGELGSDSSLKHIKKVVAAREVLHDTGTKKENRLKQAKAREVKAVKEFVKKARPKNGQKALSDFISALEC